MKKLQKGIIELERSSLYQTSGIIRGGQKQEKGLLFPVHIARPLNLKLHILATSLLLQLPNKRQHVPSKLLNLLFVVQESREDDVDAEGLEHDDALGDLLLGADQLRLEAVVVLHEVFEFRVGPHAALVAGGRAGVLDLLAEPLDGFGVGFALDFLQHADGFFFRLSADDECVQGEADLAFTTVLRCALLDVVDLALEAFESVAVHEVVVRDGSRILLRIVRVSTLEDLGVWAAREVQRLRLERIVVELVEVTLEGELLVGPDTLQTCDEFFAAAVTLGVVEPPLTDAGELE